MKDKQHEHEEVIVLIHEMHGIYGAVACWQCGEFIRWHEEPLPDEMRQYFVWLDGVRQLIGGIGGVWVWAGQGADNFHSKWKEPNLFAGEYMECMLFIEGTEHEEWWWRWIDLKKEDTC